MNRYEALQHISGLLDGALVIAANGMISRELFALRDRPTTFYMIGSMGLACSIGLGVAIHQPARRVIVLDGDGNVLMNLGALAMVVAVQPKNFLHVVLDNEAHASTGGQRTLSDRVPLERVAAAAGYAQVAKVADPEALATALHRMLQADGPAFLLAKITAENQPGIGRVQLPPEQIAARFASAVAGSQVGQPVGTRDR